MIDAIRHALRRLLARGQRAGTVVSVGMLALGVAGVTCVFGVLWSVLLAPLPFREVERLRALVETKPSAGIDMFSVSGENLRDWNREATRWSGFAGYARGNANLAEDGAAERVEAVYATPNLFEIAGLPLLAGRSFLPAEDIAESPAVIIGETLWERRFDRDPAVLGRTLRVDGRERTIVGIAPRDAGFTAEAALWLPLGLPQQPWGRGDRRLEVFGRIADGAGLAEAEAELRAIAARLAQRYPDDNRDWSAASVPVRDYLVGETLRQRVQVLAGAVLLLLLVACLNVANLELARATTRVRELGVRSALGASRGRLLRDVVVESSLIAIAGSVLGTALGGAALRATMAALALPAREQNLPLDGALLMIAVAAAALTALACALAPAWLALRAPVAHSLQAAGRGGTEQRRMPIRQVLVVAQFACATVLLVAAGALIAQLRAMERNALGFVADGVLVARVTLPDDDNGTNYARNVRDYARLLEALRAIPGVRTAGLGSEVPLGQFNTTSMNVAPGRDAQRARDAGAQAAWRVVAPEFLDALGVPVLRGRNFDPLRERSHSMLLSAGLAKRLFPEGGDALGREVTLSNGQTYTVVGIVADVRQRERGGEPTPTMYMSPNWAMLSTMTLALRVEGDPAAMIPRVREAAARVLPEHPLFDLAPMQTVADGSLAAPRAQARVVSVFGFASALLAAFGIAAVTAFLVARRRAELALRLAIGATPRRIVGHVLRGTGVLAAIGIAAGTALGYAVLPLLGPGAAPSGAVAASVFAPLAALVLAGLAAAWLPARRAARIAPSVALRGD